MNELRAILYHLISTKITTSQSLANWFPDFQRKFQAHFQEALLSGEIHHYVRDLYERKVIRGDCATHLLQMTLWLDEEKRTVNDLHRKGVIMIIPGDDEYPEAFESIVDKPAVLFVYGKVALLQMNCRKITLVGTRHPSAWAMLKAKQFAYEAAACQVTTVSGYANGIDTGIFNETLARHGNTIAILPQLPREPLLPDRNTSLLISEFPPQKSEPSKWQFIARNRLLAALSPVTVIVEAPLRSGTLITAELAQSYGKSVYVVVPEPYEDSAYGGLCYGIVQLQGGFIQSIYDIFFNENWEDSLEKYKEFIDKLSFHRLHIPKKDHRHLAVADVKRILLQFCRGDLSRFEQVVIELQRFGIIRERKNNIVINFSGYNSWPKI